MNPADATLRPAQDILAAAIDNACALVAPNWPLDRSIAMNPFWAWIDRPFDDAAGQLARLSGATLLMPRSFYQQAWDGQRFTARHLAEALREAGLADRLAQAEAALGGNARPAPRPAPLPLLSDLLDARRQLDRAPAWRATITHQIAQFCAANFDRDQADWRPAPAPLFGAWRATVAHDHGIAMLMHAPAVAARASQLPEDARAAIAFVLERLVPPAGALGDLLAAALLRINGWAAWCAYLRWQARLDGTEDGRLVDLLAIRLAWEFLLDDGERGVDSTWSAWQQAFHAVPPAPSAPGLEAVFQRALELAYQEQLAGALAASPATPAQSAAPAVQAVFCIDVRSEVYRRALEGVTPAVQTIGLAGFFGLAASYTPLGTAVTRPQLPGLLAPRLHVTESCGSAAADHALARTRHDRLAGWITWRAFQRMPASAFALVETLGPGYLARLVRRTLPAAGASPGPEQACASLPANARPTLQLTGPDAAARKVALAAGVLKAMALGRHPAPLVLLVGHGGQSANNPHAAGLDCGACGGQTGEVNARAVALLLNEPQVRQGLAEQGPALPASTHFVAALHNTTTDDVTLFDTDLIPAHQATALAQLRSHLDAASTRARKERAPALGLHAQGHDHTLARALGARARDWAQTRPEWGLANNAAVIVAPRARTRAVHLEGRAFLHDYDHAADADHSVLELIMTAPIVVTHWINMQYYASTVDNVRYGSGNKVLHNVVGGRLGVFEGNGGDLRIGLPMQSLHDGTRWVHTPLRLSVFIEAPRAGIDTVLATHTHVRHLVEHNWLYLLRIDPATGAVERRSATGWAPFAGGAAG